MTINLETEIVASGHDLARRVHTFTVARDGKRWTAEIPDADLARHGPKRGASAASNQANRRRYLATVLEGVMLGAPDA